MSTYNIPKESEEHQTLLAYLRAKNLKCHHSPNETGSSLESRRRAVRMKRAGTSKGFPDFLILVNNQMIVVELKRIKGSSTSTEQKEWIEAFNQANIPAKICRGAGEAIDFINQHS